jgi:hypothetical protein
MPNWLLAGHALAQSAPEPAYMRVPTAGPGDAQGSPNIGAWCPTPEHFVIDRENRATMARLQAPSTIIGNCRHAGDKVARLNVRGRSTPEWGLAVMEPSYDAIRRELCNRGLEGRLLTCMSLPQPVQPANQVSGPPSNAFQRSPLAF